MSGKSNPAVQASPDISALTEQIQQESLKLDHVLNEMDRVIVGQRPMLERILIGFLCGGHVLLEGVPGLAKTLTVSSLARIIQASFKRIQFTPDLLPADLTGTLIYQQHSGEFVARKGPIFANLILADEINRAPAKVQSALLEAMQERQVTIGDTSYPLDDPFLVMATQNPIEQEGTYPLPEAQLDRFFFKLQVGYSTRDELSEILNRTTSGQSIKLEPVLDAESILRHQSLVRSVDVPASVQDYAVRIVMATHPGGELATPQVNTYLRFGASPRAAQALILSAKVKALLAGRVAASAEDVRSVVLPAMRHRCLLNFEGEAEGMTTDNVLQNLIDTLPADIGVLNA